MLVLFAYGSLLDAASRARTLPDPADVAVLGPVRVSGVRVAANAQRDGTEGDVYLGLVPCAGASAWGVLLRVTTARARDALVRREALYRLVPLGGGVHTFVTLPRHRLATPRPNGVSAAYRAMVRRGFATHGLPRPL